MKHKAFQSQNTIRLLFTHAMSHMYQNEVPQYKQLMQLAATSNSLHGKALVFTHDDVNLLPIEHHGAIRLGTAHELFTLRRLFAVMGMHPVEYYDLSASDIPVHSTAFRAIHSGDLNISPFRVFCSLLRLDLMETSLRKEAEEVLATRQMFSQELLKLITLAEKQGGLLLNEAHDFINEALEVFRWHKQATLEKIRYERLKSAHGLIADIVSFKGAHINHLTLRVLDIDDCQHQFKILGIEAKSRVEGPPSRQCPILLRQTSFLAIAEPVHFTDGEIATHTARFGELEQRGIALTPKGRELYGSLLSKARNANKEKHYNQRLHDAFLDFPDTYESLYQQDLAYFKYKINPERGSPNHPKDDINRLLDDGYLMLEPIRYEDFLPVSAAGIFTSNLREEDNRKSPKQSKCHGSSFAFFEESLGTKVLSAFDLYENEQQESLHDALHNLYEKR